MEFSEEWKSLWPISSVFNPPLLLLDGNPPTPPKRRRLEDEEEQQEEEKTHEEIGPIIFTPCPKSLIQLYSSPSLAPRLPAPYPGLTLARFLVSSTLNSATPLSSITYSVSSHIASEIGSELVLSQHESHDYLHGFNCLQLLRLPCGGDDESWAYLAFFPAGENCDQVGFVKLFLKGNFLLEVELNHGNQDVFVANQRLNSRILQLLVNPVSDFDDTLSADAASSFSSSAGLAVVGYLMACSMHSVYWYAVKTTSGADGLGGKCTKVDFVGQRLFGISEVVHACWSPHLSEESVVLLETGELYLFGISSCLEKHPSSNNRVGMKKLNALWSTNKDFENSGRGGWISVEFSWHPRILIAAHAVAVFLVDARSYGCNLSCLLKIQMLSNIQHDRFIGLCRAGCDGFRFCVTSGRLLMLCDIRQPFRPLLRWVHSLDSPRYITVFRLSELRSNTNDDKFKWATDSGSCILLGSFWNSEFSLFVYGPNNKTKTVSSEISKFCNSFYAWGLPSEFSLSAYGTHCGRFLIREEYLKDALPVWFDWRQKTGVVLGFGIFSRDPLAPLPKSDTVDGFLLIRLTSSGKLEAQRYHAVGECGRISDETHRKTLCNSQADLLYEMSHEEDDLNIKFNFLNIQYLQGYLNGNLAEILSNERKQVHKVGLKEEAGKESNEESMVGDPTGYGSLQRIFDVFKDINLPTSIYEIALRCIWANMPEYLERLALSSHSKYPEAPKFESYGIPFQIPSYYGNTKSRKFLPSKALKQSFLPPHFWLTLRISGMLGKKNLVILSAEEEIQLQCDRAMEAAGELTRARTEAESELDDTYAVSLADDTDEINIGDGDVRNFFFHKPVALLDEVCTMEMKCEKFRTWSKRFTTFLYRKQELSPDVSPEMVGLDLLNAGCPIQLTFNDSDIFFDPNELKTLQVLKKQHLDFQKGFGLYQEYITRDNFKK